MSIIRVFHSFFDSHPISFKFCHSFHFLFMLPCLSMTNFPILSPHFWNPHFLLPCLSISFQNLVKSNYPLEFFPTPNFPFLKKIMFFYFYNLPPCNKKKLIVMVVTRTGATKQMEDKLVTLKTKLQDMDETILGLHLQHSSMNNKWQPSLLQTLGSLLLVFFVGWSLVFLTSMVMIWLDGYTEHNNISLCITLLMSTKYHFIPFVWNMNPFNGYVGTLSLMKIQIG